MKKIFTLVAMATFAFTANAQTESAFVDVDALNILPAVDKVYQSEYKNTTVLCESENVKMSALNDDAVQAVAMWADADAVKTVSIDGVEYQMPTGVQGETNGKDALEGGNPLGWQLKFDVKADGWLYVFGKLTCNKSYYVWEGDIRNQTANLVAYSLIGAQVKDGKVVNYTLPKNDDGLYVAGNGYDNGTKLLTADQCTEMFNVAGLTPETVPASKADELTVWNNKGNALGVVAFPVYGNVSYTVHAAGSKWSGNGFVFIKGATSLAKVEFGAGSTGISDVAVAKAEKAAKKALVNGRLVIEKNDKQFSVAGAQLK